MPTPSRSRRLPDLAFADLIDCLDADDLDRWGAAELTIRVRRDADGLCHASPGCGRGGAAARLALREAAQLPDDGRHRVCPHCPSPDLRERTLRQQVLLMAVAQHRVRALRSASWVDVDVEQLVADTFIVDMAGRRMYANQLDEPVLDGPLPDGLSEAADRLRSDIAALVSSVRRFWDSPLGGVALRRWAARLPGGGPFDSDVLLGATIALDDQRYLPGVWEPAIRACTVAAHDRRIGAVTKPLRLLAVPSAVATALWGWHESQVAGPLRMSDTVEVLDATLRLWEPGSAGVAGELSGVLATVRALQASPRSGAPTGAAAPPLGVTMPANGATGSPVTYRPARLFGPLGAKVGPIRVAATTAESSQHLWSSQHLCDSRMVPSRRDECGACCGG